MGTDSSNWEILLAAWPIGPLAPRHRRRWDSDGDRYPMAIPGRKMNPKICPCPIHHPVMLNMVNMVNMVNSGKYGLNSGKYGLNSGKYVKLITQQSPMVNNGKYTSTMGCIWVCKALTFGTFGTFGIIWDCISRCTVIKECHKYWVTHQ